MPATLNIAAAEHPIKSVTVFKSSKAEIVRTFTLDLEAGQTKVHITGLPGAIDTDSVRVSGLGQARLFDVVCTTKNGENATDGSTEAIRLLNSKRANLEAQKTVFERRVEILSAYASTLSGEHNKPTEVSQFLSSFAQACLENLTSISELNEEMVEIDRDISKEKEKRSMKKGWAMGEVTVVIGTDERSSVELKLTYIVGNASWEPTYELRATTENGKPSSSVSLHYRARVKQSTGEDWSDTALTLNTVTSDTVTRSIPHLRTIKIRSQPSKGFTQQFQQQQQQQQQPRVQVHTTTSTALFGQAPPKFSFGGSAPDTRSSGLDNLPAVFGSSSLFGGTGPAASEGGPAGGALEHVEEEAFEDVAVPGLFSEPTTIVTQSPLAVSYAVDGKSTIPSDGVAHQVSIAILPFSAEITHVAIPRIQPHVYLQCKVKNTSEYRLLPGPVTVILDDSYVSKTSIFDINTGDIFHCTLGTDSATKVTYSRSSRTVKSSVGNFAEAINSTTCTSVITIHNKHAFAITDLIVRDAVPLCEDKRVKVILRKPEGLATAKDGQIVHLERDGLKVFWEKVVDGKGGEKEGKFEWSWKVEAGAQIKLEAEWEVKAPADIPWVESTAC